MTTEAGKRLLRGLATEHCGIDEEGCHDADDVLVADAVPLIEAEAIASERTRISKAVRGLMAKTTKRSDPNAALAAVLALLYPKP
jgi:hypothetical protein